MILRRLFTKRNSIPKDQEELYSKIKKGTLPKHVSIIMDGNGRWAQKRGLPRAMGHRYGVEIVRDIIKTSADLGIEYLTLYAFSTENWKRPDDEVSAIMKLLVEYLSRELDDLHKNNVKINTIGDISILPREALQEINKALQTTKANTGLQVNVALNYGGRAELVMALKEISRKVLEGLISLEDIDEKLISKNLYTMDIPDPDLLIRTGGDRRISNFLLYQMAYTEFWFSDSTVYWPDFGRNNYLKAIYDFQNRNRRFGGILTEGDNK